MPASEPPAATTDEPLHRKAARYAWALLLARIYDQRECLWAEAVAEPRRRGFFTCLRHKIPD